MSDPSSKQVVVVTGTSKGIGRAIAEHYLGRGWIVAGCSRGESDLSHANYRHHCVDVTDEKSVVEMVRATSTEFGRIDGLINNAGIAAMNHLLLTPAATASSVMATNYLGSFVFLREVAKAMSRRKAGSIVNFSTVAVAYNLEGEAAYAASKAAVESLTRVAARELGPMGIRVNAIGPTPIRTALIRTVPKDKIEKLLERQAIPRFGEFADVINVLDFFLEPRSSFITGQVLYLGGASV